MPGNACFGPSGIAGFQVRQTPFLPILLLALFGLSGCYLRQAYYVSPFNGNTGGYHSLPTVKDSGRSAVYSRAIFFTGGANDNQTDHLNGFTGGAYEARHLGILQFYYGADVTLGGFYLGKWDTTMPSLAPPSSSPVLLRSVPSGPPPTAAALNRISKGYFFGGVTFSGGINLVVPLKDGEWRILGVEASTTQEFGKYLSLRKKMPDSLATLIIRDNAYSTFGFTTELLGHTRHGEFGFRLAVGTILGHEYQNAGVYNNAQGSPLHFGYLAGSFHYTYRQYTGFLQLNTATKATDLLVGLNYRFWAGRKRKSTP